MEISSAKFESFEGENVCITAVINGKTYLVPIDTDNTHYQAIQEWVKEGNTIEESD